MVKSMKWFDFRLKFCQSVVSHGILCCNQVYREHWISAWKNIQNTICNSESSRSKPRKAKSSLGFSVFASIIFSNRIKAHCHCIFLI